MKREQAIKGLKQLLPTDAEVEVCEYVINKIYDDFEKHIEELEKYLQVDASMYKTCENC